MITEHIKTDILSSYVSTNEPQFGFVQRRLNDPYPICQKLVNSYVCEEDTDENTDVAFVYRLGKNGESVLLMISMVGRYALLARIDSEAVELLGPDTSAGQSQFEQEVTNLVESEGFKILEKNELLVPIRVQLFNTGVDKVTVYQALFSDNEYYPWEKTS
jgi:hypothetical protein